MSEELDRLVHENTYYEVILIARGNRKDTVDAHGATVDGNYEVRNRQYGTTEYRCDNQPSALSVAEHYNSIMDNRLYMLDGAEDIEEVFINLKPSDDDDGGVKH